MNIKVFSWDYRDLEPTDEINDCLKSNPTWKIFGVNFGDETQCVICSVSIETVKNYLTSKNYPGNLEMDITELEKLI